MSGDVCTGFGGNEGCVTPLEDSPCVNIEILLVILDSPEPATALALGGLVTQISYMRVRKRNVG